MSRPKQPERPPTEYTRRHVLAIRWGTLSLAEDGTRFGPSFSSDILNLDPGRAVPMMLEQLRHLDETEPRSDGSWVDVATEAMQRLETA